MIGLLERDRQKVRPIVAKVFASQIDMWNKFKESRKPSGTLGKNAGLEPVVAWLSAGDRS